MPSFSDLFAEKRTWVLAIVLGGLVVVALIVWVVHPSGMPTDSNPDLAQLDRAAAKGDLETLKNGLNHSNPDVAAVALGKLAAISPSTARQHVFNSLSDSRWQVRQQAVRAVPRVYTRASTDRALIDTMNQLGKSDSSDSVRSAVAASAIQMEWLDGEKAWGLIPGLISQLDDSDRTVRASAKTSLEKILYLRISPNECDVEPPAPNPRRQKYIVFLTQHLPGMKQMVVDWYDHNPMKAKL